MSKNQVQASLQIVGSICLLPMLAVVASGQSAPTSIGIFEGHSDVGTVLHAGGVEYDSGKRTYTVSGSGENMWAAADSFHFVWKKVSSNDVSLSATIAILGEGGDPHRKAVIMFRQNLEAGSAYADAAVHGDGLTSLQFRDGQGVATHEIQANVSGPKRLKLTKRGQDFFMSYAKDDGKMQLAGGSIRFALNQPFYVGIGVCAHNKDNIQKALFSDVELITTAPATTGSPVLHSTLETVTVASTDRRVVYMVPGRVEAPNWTPDGKSLLVNMNGKLLRVAATGGPTEAVNTGSVAGIISNHGVSPDGTLIAFSDQSQADRRSRIYTVPVAGGTPKPVTTKGPSYWHGWSPDGKTLVFAGERDSEFDVYSIPLEGGEEKRLTTAKGRDDGPEYSPDGQHIYFNSDRSGRMQLWRMRADGSEQEQLTSDEYKNWYPHPSPDGLRLAFLSYEKDVQGNPENKDVMIRVITLADKSVRVIAKLMGGQGTMEAPSWSPDSRRLSFVSYQLIAPEKQ